MVGFHFSITPSTILRWVSLWSSEMSKQMFWQLYNTKSQSQTVFPLKCFRKSVFHSIALFFLLAELTSTIPQQLVPVIWQNPLLWQRWKRRNAKEPVKNQVSAESKARIRKVLPQINFPGEEVRSGKKLLLFDANKTEMVPFEWTESVRSGKPERMML